MVNDNELPCLCDTANIIPSPMKLISVHDDYNRFNLSPENVQVGDVVHVELTGKEYIVTDIDKLNDESGYDIYGTNSSLVYKPSNTSSWKWSSTSDHAKISVGNSISDLEEEIKMLKENMNRKLNITMLHGCRSCGAKFDVDINKPVFCCPACGTAYVIGKVQLNSTY